MMSARANRRSSRPYEAVPMSPADRHRRRQQAEPHVAHAEPLLRVEDEDGPGRPERDVEGDDREGERPHRRVCGEPAEPLGDVAAPGRDAAARRSEPRSGDGLAVAVTRMTRTAPSAKQAASVANGSAMPDREQERPDRRRDELVGQQDGAR